MDTVQKIPGICPTFILFAENSFVIDLELKLSTEKEIKVSNIEVLHLAIFNTKKK